MQNNKKKYLTQYPRMNGLIPAIIIEIRAKEATASLDNGEIILIPWQLSIMAAVFIILPHIILL